MMRRMVGDSVGILKRTMAAHFNLTRIWTLSLCWIAGFDRQMICSCNAVFALAEPLDDARRMGSAATAAFRDAFELCCPRLTLLPCVGCRLPGEFDFAVECDRQIDTALVNTIPANLHRSPDCDSATLRLFNTGTSPEPNTNSIGPVFAPVKSNVPAFRQFEDQQWVKSSNDAIVVQGLLQDG